MFRRQSGEMILNEYNNRPRDIRNRPHRLYIESDPIGLFLNGLIMLYLT